MNSFSDTGPLTYRRLLTVGSSREITSDYTRMTTARHPIYRALVALTTNPFNNGCGGQWCVGEDACLRKTCANDTTQTLAVNVSMSDTAGHCAFVIHRGRSTRWRKSFDDGGGDHKHCNVSRRCLLGLRFSTIFILIEPFSEPLVSWVEAAAYVTSLNSFVQVFPPPLINFLRYRAGL